MCVCVHRKLMRSISIGWQCTLSALCICIHNIYTCKCVHTIIAFFSHSVRLKCILRLFLGLHCVKLYWMNWKTTSWSHSFLQKQNRWYRTFSWFISLVVHWLFIAIKNHIRNFSKSPVKFLVNLTFQKEAKKKKNSE